jgi:hypothetical protein
LWITRNKFTIEEKFPRQTADSIFKIILSLQLWRPLQRTKDGAGWAGFHDQGLLRQYLLSSSDHSKPLAAGCDAGRITTQLGTPRGRYDEQSSKFSLSKKPRFIVLVGKSQTQEGDTC